MVGSWPSSWGSKNPAMSSGSLVRRNGMPMMCEVIFKSMLWKIWGDPEVDLVIDETG